MSGQRELRQQYKENPPACGVYLIKNQRNQRYLIGSSNNLDGALNRHRFELKMKNHRNKALQQDWLADGGEHISFAVLDTLKLSDDPAFDAVAELAALLAMWTAELQASGAQAY